MTILFLIGAMGRGGKERRLQVLLKHLSQNPEYDLHLLVRNHHLAYEDFKNYKIHYSIILKEGEAKKPIKNLIKIWQYVRKTKPQLIQVWGNADAAYMNAIAKLFKIPVINNEVTTATPPGILEKYISKLNFRFATHIISNSKAGLISYQAPLHKSSVIYNGFNFDRFTLSNPNVRQAINIPSSAIAVIMVARMHPGKDFESLVNAALQIVQNNDNVHFLLAGDGPERTRIEKLIPADNERIRVLGLRTDIEQILLACDIGVLLNDASIMQEGLSNSILEYMAAGLPVIATNAGGTPEIVQDGKTGYLVESQNERQIQERLELLIRDHILRKEMGENAKARIMTDFSIDAFVRKHEEIIRRFIRKN